MVNETYLFRIEFHLSKQGKFLILISNMFSYLKFFWQKWLLPSFYPESEDNSMISVTCDTLIDDLDMNEELDKFKLLLALCGRNSGDLNAVDETDRRFQNLKEASGRDTSDIFGRDEINYEQLNELLLLVEESSLSRAFYKYFLVWESLEKDREIAELQRCLPKVRLDELKTGVKKFRCLALLGFGNFRHAFNILSQIKDVEDLINHPSLREWTENSSELKADFKNRPTPVAPIEDETKIDVDKTWYLGYLTLENLRNDRALAEAINAGKDDLDQEDFVSRLQNREDPELVNKGESIWPPNSSTVNEYKTQVEELLEEAEEKWDELSEIQELGKANAKRYLTWDYLDVYVATSMRNSWEFKNTFNVVNDIFESDELSELNLRYFDPTQSYESVTTDKGLIEALMLKRAKCTLYMAQESDTLGKDSELAATLAQGKPVIAYIPEIATLEELEKFGDELKDRPLSYFYKRVNDLFAEEFFLDDQALQEVTDKIDQLGIDDRANGSLVSDNHLTEYMREVRKELSELKNRQVFQVLGSEGQSLKNDLFEDANFPCLHKVMAAIESVAFDKRASVIGKYHPLSFQVHLESGVANGVLVARDTSTVINVLSDMLLNSLSFEVKSVIDSEDWRSSFLVEEHTESRFRVVTGNEMLTNSFWNFYFS